MKTDFPDASELGSRLSVHDVNPVKGMGAQLIPGAIGALFFGVPGLIFVASARSAAEVGASLASSAIGVGLIALSVWLVKRKVRSLPSCAVYERGVAVRDPQGIHWLPYGSFRVTQCDVVLLGSSVAWIEIAGAGVRARLVGLHHRKLEELARRLERALA